MSFPSRCSALAAIGEALRAIGAELADATHAALRAARMPDTQAGRLAQDRSTLATSAPARFAPRRHKRERRLRDDRPVDLAQGNAHG